MWFLILIAVALLVAIPVSLVISLVNRGELRRLGVETERLRRRLDEMATRGPVLEGPSALPIPSSEPQPSSAPAPAPPAAPAPPPAARATRDFETRIGGQWLTWLGILAIFFGTAFFLGVDLGDHALAGMGQVLTGVAVGFLFVGAGRLFSKKTQAFLGQGLLGGGIALLFLAAYAAHGFHGLVSAAVVYPSLLAVAVVGALLAILQGSLMAASLTLVGALVTPWMLRGEGDPTRALLPYLVAVNVGTVLVSRQKAWPVLPLGGFFGTLLLTVAWLDQHDKPEHRAFALASVGAVWLLYALLPLLTRPGSGLWGFARGFIVVSNGLAFAGFLCAILSPDLTRWQGAALAVLALVCLLGAFAATRARGPLPGIRATHYTGIAVLAVAAPVQFDLSAVTMSWTALGAVLYFLGVREENPGHRLLGLGVFLCSVFRVAILDALNSFERVETLRPVLNGSFLVGAATAAVLCVSGRLLARHRSVLRHWERFLPTAFLLLGVLLFFLRISTETAVIFAAKEETTGRDLERAMLLTLSLVWAIYAGLVIVSGFLARFRPLRILGVAILGGLIIKVFTLDMQVLEKGYRIASFVGVGVLLLAISLLYQRERKA